MFGKHVCWFEKMFGFKETGYSLVKQNLIMEGTMLKSKINNRAFDVGRFSTPSLSELREQVENTRYSAKRDGPPALKITHYVVSDIYKEHMNPLNEGAMFQVASQFNCLEFVSPQVVPERGVTGYISDPTQGPACSLACSAATVYRNYFVPTPAGNEGQTRDDQINNLEGLESLVNNQENKFWKTKNGYTNSSNSKLQMFNTLYNQKKFNRNELLNSMRIGIQEQADVIKTKENQEIVHKVSQAFCSGISVGYSQASTNSWKIISKIVLDAAYESTLLATIINAQKGIGSKVVILTFIGGGVFGNEMSWIISAIGRACALLAHHDLEVKIAYHRTINQDTANEIDKTFKEYLLRLQ